MSGPACEGGAALRSATWDIPSRVTASYPFQWIYPKNMDAQSLAKDRGEAAGQPEVTGAVLSHRPSHRPSDRRCCRLTVLALPSAKRSASKRTRGGRRSERNRRRAGRDRSLSDAPGEALLGGVRPDPLGAGPLLPFPNTTLWADTAGILEPVRCLLRGGGGGCLAGNILYNAGENGHNAATRRQGPEKGRSILPPPARRSITLPPLHTYDWGLVRSCYTAHLQRSGATAAGLREAH
ncbi:hypothetical protein AAFF_G00140970 [Aldrovandia affinis]|uniref:Uncharacterized protein n=1 Tax=Aldrovandia affinis TaxID=143900 RepID=A0AAD7TCR3_9TELE|nr:hypothetical protein AAFF_G00140970 [Aldrovandia affinis]